MAQAEVAARKKTGIFYGYWILVAAFFIFFINSGCGFYSFGLFVNPLEKSFGWSRSSIMLGNTMLNLAQGFGGIFVGRIIKRFGMRRVLIAGTVITTLCFIGLSNLRDVWQLYVCYGIAGLGLSTTFSPPSALILNWFKRRRGLYVGLAGVGLGFAGVVMPALLGGAIIPAFGWQAGYLTLGLLASATTIPLTLFIIREKPQDLGLLPDGDSEPSEAKAKVKPAVDGLTTKQAALTPAFWLIAISGAAYGFSTQAITLNQVPHLQDIGYPVLQAASALGAVGVGSSIGKLLFGVVCDCIGSRWSRIIGLSFQLAAVAILITVNSSTSLVVIWVYALLLGFGLGSWVPTQTLQVSSNFGIADYVTISSMIGIFHTLGGSIGPLFAAFIHDTQGTYQVAFVSFAVMYTIAIAATLLTRRPKSYKGPATAEAVH